MKVVLLLVLFIFRHPAFSQCIADVYPLYDVGPFCASVQEPDVVVLNPIPFESSYLIEFGSDIFVSTVQLDKNLDGIFISVYKDGKWVRYEMYNQTFIINAKVRYLLVTYKQNFDSVYLLID
jgi:hypothetical protein